MKGSTSLFADWYYKPSKKKKFPHWSKAYLKEIFELKERKTHWSSVKGNRNNCGVCSPSNEISTDASVKKTLFAKIKNVYIDNDVKMM